MFESNKKLTVEEIKDLYPGIRLIEGYDEAIVGVVTASNDEFVPVYDTFKIIDIISKMGFKSKKELNEYFSKLVDNSKATGIGPLFMQSIKVKTPKTRSDIEYVDEVFANEDKAWAEWKDDSDSDSGSDSEEELPYGYTYADEDSDSDYEDIEDNSDEYEDDYDDEDDDEEANSFLQITMHIGSNDPKECKMTTNPNKVKDALFTLFPNLTNLELIKEIKFYFNDSNREDKD